MADTMSNHLGFRTNASLRLRVAVVLSLFHTVSALNCSTPPVYVDVHDRSVHGTDVFAWGAFMGIGTPSQNQSLWPSLRQNQTSVASAELFCNNSRLANCSVSTNGNFGFSGSST